MRKDSYIETKRRLSRCFDIKNMSDKEIIEVLDNEIKQYRERIEQLQEQVKELYNREIKSETITLLCKNYYINNVEQKRIPPLKSQA